MTVKYADENAVVTKGEALLPTGKFTLQTEVSADGTAEIFIDGEMILRAEGTNAEGYICLGQKSVAAGAVEAEIDNVVILNNYYDRPQNSEIIADFNDDDYNVNDWYIKSTAGSPAAYTFRRDSFTLTMWRRTRRLRRVENTRILN